MLSGEPSRLTYTHPELGSRRISLQTSPDRDITIVKPQPDGRLAIRQGSSDSGIYLSHRQSYYFGVPQIEYGNREGMDIAEVELWLGPALNYIPQPAIRAAE
jgi:hypothetical protein